jgi:hypothetical protein
MLWHLESWETVSLVFKSEHMDTIDYGATQRQLLPHVNYDGDESVLLKALRLWISKKDDIFEPEVKNEFNVQTIGKGWEVREGSGYLSAEFTCVFVIYVEVSE